MQDLCKTAGKTARKTIPVCYRNGESGKIEIAEAAYEGPLEAKTMRRVNKLFLEKAGSGYFYPLEPMDAYGDVWLALERKAASLPELAKASPDTYLNAVARIQFLGWFKRKVEPVRTTYRAVERRTVGKGATGEDGFDIDNHDGTADNPGKAMADASKEPCEESVPVGSALTAQQLAEQLPGCPSARERRLRAALELEEIYAALLDAGHVRIVCAFRAFVLEDGHFPRAARRARIAKTTYYREWPDWLAAARKVGEKTAAPRH